MRTLDLRLWGGIDLLVVAHRRGGLRRALRSLPQGWRIRAVARRGLLGTAGPPESWPQSLETAALSAHARLALARTRHDRLIHPTLSHDGTRTRLAWMVPGARVSIAWSS